MYKKKQNPKKQMELYSHTTERLILISSTLRAMWKRFTCNTKSVQLQLYFFKGTIANAMLCQSILRELNLRSFTELDIDPRLGHSLSRVYA